MSRTIKLGVFGIAFVLGFLASEMVLPTPNAVHGGTIKMFLIIGLTVAFKAGIEASIARLRGSKRSRKKHLELQQNQPKL